MATAAKLVLQHLRDAPMRTRAPREILAHLRTFLLPLTDGSVDDREEISNASPVRKGER